LWNEKTPISTALPKRPSEFITPEQALLLASHGVKRNADGSYSWKFDEYKRARAPYRLSPDDHIALWSRITCPTLLLRGKKFSS
jgi:hypothetical protein